MKINCKTCGRAYSFEPPYIDGQEIICPYCGASNVYHAPSRIELPPRAQSARVPAAQSPRADSAPPRADSATPGMSDSAPPDTVREVPAETPPDEQPMQPVSRLHVIRPSAGASSARPSGDNALVERVRTRARSEGRRALLRKIGIVFKDLFWFAVLAAILFGGWKIFRAWQKSSAPAEGEVQGSESVETARQTEQVAKAEPTARPQTVAPEGATGAPVRSKPAESAASSADALKTLKGARVSFYGQLPPSERLGTVAGWFAVVIPYGNKTARCYLVESCATGLVSAVRCDDGLRKDSRAMGRGDAASAGECQTELRRQGGFVVGTGVAYYETRPNSPKVWNPPLDSSEEFCASKSYFENAHELVRQYGWKTDDLRFEISLAFGKTENPVHVATARFGEKTGYASFRKVAEEIALRIRAVNLPRPKDKTYRRTVVFSDGSLIASSLNGITKVPRRSQYEQGPEYLRWLKLSEEAERQERECRRVQKENEDRLRAWKKKVEAPVSDEEVRKVLMASSVKIARKQEAH